MTPTRKCTCDLQLDFTIFGNTVYLGTVNQHRQIRDVPIDLSTLPAAIQNSTADKIVEYLRTGCFFLDFRNNQARFLESTSIENATQVMMLSPQNNLKSFYEKAIELYENKQYQEAISCFHQIVDLLTGEPKHDLFRAKIYDLMSYAGSVLGSQEWAIEYSQKSLSLKCALLGENHPALDLNYSTIAANYGTLKDLKNALIAHLKVLDIRIQEHGRQHLQVTITYEHIAYIYQELGEFQKALFYHQEALKNKKMLFKRESMEVADSHECIGHLFYLLGDCQHMYESFSEAREIQTKLLGKNHRYIALNYNNTGFGLYKAGKYEFALVYYQHSLETWLQLDPTTYPYQELESTVNNILSCSREPMCQSQEAKDTLATCNNLCASILGKMHPLTCSLNQAHLERR